MVCAVRESTTLLIKTSASIQAEAAGKEGHSPNLCCPTKQKHVANFVHGGPRPLAAEWCPPGGIMPPDCCLSALLHLLLAAACKSPKPPGQWLLLTNHKVASVYLHNVVEQPFDFTHEVKCLPAHASLMIITMCCCLILFILALAC